MAVAVALEVRARVVGWSVAEPLARRGSIGVRRVSAVAPLTLKLHRPSKPRWWAVLLSRGRTRRGSL